MPKQSATGSLTEAGIPTRLDRVTTDHSTREPSRDRLATIAALARRAWPGWLLALSLNGFFLYLGVLDLLEVEPRASLTGGYYALLAIALSLGAWRNRARLRRRFAAPGRLVTVFVGSAVVLVIWFLLNVALLSEERLAWKFAALLVLWSLPSALLAASLSRPELRQAAYGLVALGLVFLAIEAATLGRAGAWSGRYSPIEELDPISSAQIPALAAIAAAALTRPAMRVSMPLVALVVLSAGAPLPGSRGPVLALMVGALAVSAVAGSAWKAIVPALGIGLVAGVLLSSQLGTEEYLTEPLRGGSEPSSELGAASVREPPPISTISIRRQWLREALAAAPERPVFGHGVAMFVDDTPEAHRMGVAGTRTYPHSSLAEAAFSLGLLGLVPYVAMLVAAGWALVRLARRRGAPTSLAFGLAAFGFVASNLSGEIGADAVLWAALAVTVALYGDAVRETASTR